MRELAKFRGRFPALVRINAARVREIHSANATEFRAASQRFEAELLGTLLLALEMEHRSICTAGSEAGVNSRAS